MDYEEFLRRIPKVELHCHFQGSLRPETFLDLAGKHGITLPTADPEKLYEYDNIVDFLKVFDFISLVLVDQDDFARVAYETLEDGVKLGNLRYREMFFNVTPHLEHGVGYATIVDGIIEGIRAAESDLGVRCRLIASIHRGHPPEMATSMVEEVLSSRRDEVIGVGMDAVTPDAKEGLELFTEAYRLAEKGGLHRTAHCAELPGAPAQNFATAIDLLHCERVDHGYRILEDERLVARARNEAVAFTCCLLSTAMVYGWGDLSRHPIRSMVEQGLRVTLNSDDPPMFHTDIGREFVETCRSMDFGPKQARALALNAVDAAWLSDDERRTMRRSFEQEMDTLEAELGDSSFPSFSG
jgi:adenosine deaminase